MVLMLFHRAHAFLERLTEFTVSMKILNSVGPYIYLAEIEGQIMMIPMKQELYEIAQGNMHLV